mgnify:CR=1 FL=1
MGWVKDKGGKVKKYEQGGKVGRRQDVEPRPERPPGDDIPGRGHGHHWTLEQEPVIGGWVKDKGASGKKYEKGGKVPKGKIGPTMREAMLHKAGLKKST